MKLKHVDRRLIFFWTPLQATNTDIPAWLQENIDQWLALNEGMTVEVINDLDIMSILAKEDQELCELYSQITIPACKSDIARIVWLYKYGGLYVDVHTACRCNVDNLLKLTNDYDLVIPFHPEHLNNPETLPYPIRSGVLIARKGGIFLKEVLENIKDNLRRLKQCQQNDTLLKYHISDITGPHFIAQKLQHNGGSTNMSAHCYICAQMENSIKKYKIKLISIEKYIHWHKFSSYRVEQGQYSAHHWTVLQTQRNLFEF